ncbi:Polycystic kidney disease protein 1-like 2 [Stylophora pistillata]|uniref:Polycystic kidney disease protein 1-like 2 n=1 Tax=Stylophora pistillata TaxID=50429 RepID=A0A2B4SCP9_STYPI|nr:Polycystic kidney disease protein 1-like 2 [Stylophora pistillata]
MAARFSKDCHKPLGLADGRINDSQLTASSVFGDNYTLYGPGRGRLNRTGGYRAQPGANVSSFTVTFDQPMIITEVATQGYFGNNIQEWTKGYHLGYSIGDGTHFFKEKNEDRAKQFKGNVDDNSITLHMVPRPAMLKSVHIIPTEWENNFALRLELYGCIADGNECESLPCQNNGTCLEKIRGFKCNCSDGFNGPHCEINIDDCASNPCQNNGSCLDLVNDYQCVGCLSGYSGQKCDIEIDECASSPCQNNGTCTDLLNEFYCNCSAGFKGSNCEIEVNECGSNPCHHGATCKDQINGFTCICPAGFGGPRCSQETEFFLVVWLKLKNMTFTLTLLNESSTLYQKKEDEVIHEVYNSLLFDERDHFFGSALRMFSPSELKPNVLADILLRTLMNSTKHIMAVITKKFESHTYQGIFDTGDGLVFEDRGDPSCKPVNISSPTVNGQPLSTDITQPTKVKKSEDFVFSAKLESNCRVSSLISKVHIETDIYAINTISGYFKHKRKGVLYPYADSVKQTIPSKTLDYGHYFMKIIGISDNKRKISSFGYIEVTSTTLVANISGANHASQGLNEKLTLNGSKCYDPDVGQGVYTGMNFTWLCRKESEVFPDDATTLPEVSPLAGSTLPQKRDREGCYGTGVGKLRPRNGFPYILDLDVDKMEGDEDYVIKLDVRKRGLVDFALHRLRVKEEIRLKIICEHCKSDVIQSSRLILETNCTGLLCNKIQQYSWSIKYRVKDDAHWQHVINEDEVVLTYDNSPNLILAQGKLHGNATYNVTVTGRTSRGHTSTATYSFMTNSPPSGGECKVNTAEGKAWKTDFVFSCNGWYDEELPLRFTFSYYSSEGIEMVFQSGTSNTAIGKLPVGDSNRDFKLQVQMTVADALGSIVNTGVYVQVIEPKISVEILNKEVSTEGPMNEYLKENNIEKAAQRATAVLSVVNHAPVNEMKTKEKIKIKDAIVDAWSTVKVAELQQVLQVSAVVAGVADQRNELSIESQEKAVKMLDSMANFMEKSVNNKSSSEGSVEHVGAALLNGLGNLLDITSHEAKEDTSGEELPPVQITHERREKSKAFSKRILNLVTRLGSTVDNTKKLYEKPSVLKSKSVSMVLDRQIPSRIGNKSLVYQDSKVTLPSVEVLIGEESRNKEYLSTQLVTFKHNPYTWTKGANNIKSVVIDFELKNDEGYPLNVSNLSEVVELFIPPLVEANAKKPQIYFVKPSENGTMRFHRIVFPGPEYVISIKLIPSHLHSLRLFVRYRKRPTMTNYNYSASVPDYSSCNYSKENRYTNCSTEAYIVTMSAADTGHTGLHYLGITVDAFHQTTKKNITAGQERRVRRGCGGTGRQKRSCVKVKDPPSTPPPIVVVEPSFNASTDVNYTLSVSMGTCQYWNVTADAWSPEGCKVGPRSSARKVQCLCNHLSSFGGDFFVAPNPIDFDYVIRKFPDIFESGNVLVLAMVLSIYGVWILGIVIARRADRKDENKVIENLRLQAEGGHLYEVSVYTGMWKDSGTSANVAMIVYGEEIRSETLKLFDKYSNKRLFARASVNSFTVSLPDNLNSPLMIKLWHDNSGAYPSWYVNQITIKDLETDEKWYFLCGRWLAVDKEDGEVQVDIPVASKSDLSSFKYQFYTRVTNNLVDGHIWLSLLTRPPHSPFTRSQRLSCCVCVLLSAMLAGAMFYQFGEKQNDTFKLGPFRLSVKQIVIGVQSALIVVPLNLLIVTIFRNIKVPYDHMKTFHESDKISDRYTAESHGNKKVKTPGCLPHFFVYIAWLLCILASLAAGAFLVFYSVQWGKEISRQWLTSALISFFQDVALMQPIKVVAVALLLALILKKPPEEKTAPSFKDSSLETNNNSDVKAPTGDELVLARKNRESVVETINSVVEILLYLLFVICLFVLVYGNRGYSRYRLTTSLESMLKGSFEEMDSKFAFWDWVEAEFIPGVYDTTWYNGQQFISPEGYISTRTAFLVGMPRLRQVRVKEEYPCQMGKHYSELNELFKRCIPPYSPHDEDTSLLNQPGWVPMTNISHYHSEFELSRLCPKPWRYISSKDLNTLWSYGRNTRYDGGGYVADLGYDSRTASRVVINLKSNNWIDERTAVVFVEFTVFQPSSSLFSVAKLLYELYPIGKPVTKVYLDTLSIYGFSDPSLRSFSLACQITLLLLIVYFLLIEALKIYRQSCAYFGSFWNWINILQLISALTTIAFFFLKEKYVSSFVKYVRANPFDTASADYVLFWIDLEMMVLSIVVFIVTVKFLRIIRFNKHVCQMVASLKLSSPHVMSYSVLFCINIISFVLFGVLVFGNDIESYHSFMDALATLTQKFLGGELLYDDLQSANRIIGPVYLFAFMLSMSFILINMFVAILNESYESVKEMSGGKFAEADLGTFIKEYYFTRLKCLHEILKRKLASFGYRHKLYDRPRQERKLTMKEECVGSITYLSTDYPLYMDHVYHSSQLALIENESRADTGSDSCSVEAVTLEDEPDIISAPSPVSSDALDGELLDLLTDLPESVVTPSFASNRACSNVDFMSLLRDLPESIVDDDETIDNVRKGLADVGAVLRLDKQTLRRFSTTGDKYIVQANIQMRPPVALHFRSRRNSEENGVDIEK